MISPSFREKERGNAPLFPELAAHKEAIFHSSLSSDSSLPSKVHERTIYALFVMEIVYVQFTYNLLHG